MNHRDAPDATERLIDAYAASVYRIGLHLTGSEKDAEDVAAAALRAGALRPYAFEAESAFRSWLYGVAAGAADEKMRERQPSPHEAVSHDDLPAFDDDGQRVRLMEDWSDRLGAVSTGQLRSALRAAIAGLPAVHRAVLVLHDIEGLSAAEVAAALRMDPAAVRARLHQSRLFLRRTLDRSFATTGAAWRGGPHGER